MKALLSALLATLLTALGAFAETTVTVSDVTAKQRYPWNGLVDITCSVSGIGSGTTGLKFAVAAVDQATGSTRSVSHVQVEKNGAWSDDLEVSANGTYRLLWNAAADLGPVRFESMVVRVTAYAVMIHDNGHTGVQLWEGGPYWATTNIGAEKPEDYGLYFWWGDTVGHRPSGTTSGFSFSSENCPTWDKSNATLQSEGWITANGVLAPAHDAAHVKWGGSWRTPTDQELYDLCYNKCDWTWATRNGVNGYVVRGRGAYADASIFLPAAGYGHGASLISAGSWGYYWSSVPYSSYSSLSRYSWYLCFYSGSHGPSAGYRCYGFSVRPVQGFAE